jgi:hypothetical protein
MQIPFCGIVVFHRALFQNGNHIGVMVGYQFFYMGQLVLKCAWE